MTDAIAAYNAAKATAQAAAEVAYTELTDDAWNAYHDAMELLAEAERNLPKTGTYNGVCDYLRATA